VCLPPFRLIFLVPKAVSRVQWRPLEERDLGGALEACAGEPADERNQTFTHRGIRERSKVEARAGCRRVQKKAV